MKRLMDKLYSTLCLAVALFPVYVVTGFYWLPGQPATWLLSAGCAALLGALTVLIPGRWRIPWALLCLGALAVLLPLAMLPGSMLVIGFALWGTPREAGEEWPQGYWLFGIVLGLVAQIWAFFLTKEGKPGAEQAANWLKISFAFYVGLFVLNLNHRSLLDGVSRHTHEKPPRTVRTRNTWLSLGSLALLYLAASWRALGNIIGRVVRTVAGWIVAVLAWLSQLFQSEAIRPGGGAGSRSEAFALPPDESSPFWAVLEKIAIVLTMVALVVLVVWLLYRFFKKLRVVFARLRQRLLDTANALSENYVSRTESVFDWQEVKDSAARRLRTLRPFRKRVPRWDELDDRQRVRHGYSELLRKRPDVPSSVTARRALTDHLLIDSQADSAVLADAYDQARYSDLPIQPEQAEAMRKAARIRN